MTNFKRFILYYIIGIFLSMGISLIFGGQLTSILKNIGIWVLPAFFSFLGFLTGAGVYEFMLRPKQKKGKIFLITHFISILGFVILVATMRYKDWDHNRKYRNSEANHSFMKYFIRDNEEYIRIAFNRLESEFKNPNDFKLDAFSIRKQDTTFNGIQDTVYHIYFTYYLPKENDNKYFAKLSVLDGVPTLGLYNLDTRVNSEYQKIMAEKEKTKREAIESIKESFQQMPDSVRKVVIDTIKKTLTD